jgi:UDP-2,3-diacylglucosamine pyrophosphatase LpxH
LPAPRRPLKIREVQEKYAELWDRWVEKFGYRYALKAVLGEMDSLGWFADRLCTKKGYKVVVLGHTHHAELDKDWFFGRDRAYANAGYWCTKKPSYVEVDKQKDKFVVVLKTIKEVVNGEIKTDDQKVEVPI